MTIKWWQSSHLRLDWLYTTIAPMHSGLIMTPKNAIHIETSNILPKYYYQIHPEVYWVEMALFHLNYLTVQIQDTSMYTPTPAQHSGYWLAVVLAWFMILDEDLLVQPCKKRKMFLGHKKCCFGYIGTVIYISTFNKSFSSSKIFLCISGLPSINKKVNEL